MARHLKVLIGMFILLFASVTSAQINSFNEIKVDKISPRYWKSVIFTKPIEFQSGGAITLSPSPAIRDASDSIVNSNEIFDYIDGLNISSPLFKRAGLNLIVPNTYGDWISLDESEALIFGHLDATDSAYINWRNNVDKLFITSKKIMFDNQNSFEIDSLPLIDIVDVRNALAVVRKPATNEIAQIQIDKLIAGGSGAGGHAPANGDPWGEFNVEDQYIYDSLYFDDLRHGDSTGVVLSIDANGFTYQTHEADPIYQNEKSTYVEWADTTSTIATQYFVEDRLTAHPFDADASTFTRGTEGSGTINSTDAHDNVNWQINEATGVGAGMDVTATFDSVNIVPNQIVIHGYYNGGAGHNVEVQLWNYVSDAWETYYTMTTRTTYESINVTIDDPIEHVENNEAKVRFYHSSNGVGTHRLYIDFLQLYKAPIGVAMITEEDPIFAQDSSKIVHWADTTQAGGVGVATWRDLQSLDQSATNEGSLTVGVGNANSSTIQSNTSGSTAVTISGGSGISVTESGSTITVASTGSTSGYTLQLIANVMSSWADGQTWYVGAAGGAPSTGPSDNFFIYIPKAGTIKTAYFYINFVSMGTSENWSAYIRLNNTTDYLIQTVGSTADPHLWSNTSLNISVSAGDYIALKMINPTWATNPTGCYGLGGTIFIEY